MTETLLKCECGCNRKITKKEYDYMNKRKYFHAANLATQRYRQTIVAKEEKNES